MKKTILLMIAVSAAFIYSCSSDDSSGGSSINQSDIHGWWYRNANTQMTSYKAYYFGEDGEYKQDQSNIGMGMGLGTWEWIANDKVKMTPTPGGGILGGAVECEIFKLTNDSLVLLDEGLRLCKQNPND